MMLVVMVHNPWAQDLGHDNDAQIRHGCRGSETASQVQN